MNYLDLNITNIDGKYEFKVHRKNAITNVQIKLNSSHDPKTLRGIFNGFLHRAFSVCDEKYRDEEIDFLKHCFIENGYKEYELDNIISDFKKKRERIANHQEENQLKIVSLPWIPVVSPKLRNSFKNIGYGAVFKGAANLKTILTSKNESLPPLSQPGVYMVNYGKKYVGEISLKMSTRMEQHEKSIIDKKWDSSGVSNHAKIC